MTQDSDAHAETDVCDMRVEGLRAYARWQHAQRRYERLQSAFDNRTCIEAAIERDRYMRLCAQIAIASGRADNARDNFMNTLETQGSFGGPR